MIRYAWSMVALIFWLWGLIGAMIGSVLRSNKIITLLLVCWTWCGIQSIIATTRSIARLNIIWSTATLWLLTLWSLTLIYSRVCVRLWLENSWVGSSYNLLSSRFLHNSAVAHVNWGVLSSLCAKLRRSLLNHRHFRWTFHSEIYIHWWSTCWRNRYLV